MRQIYQVGIILRKLKKQKCLYIFSNSAMISLFCLKEVIPG